MSYPAMEYMGNPLDVSDDLVRTINSRILEYDKEVRALLSNLPESIEYRYFEPGQASGVAYDLGIIGLSIDIRGPLEKSLKDIKVTVYHELYHLAQRYVINKDNNEHPGTALCIAVMEGSANVFARNRMGAKPEHSKYLDDDTMLEWLHEVKNLDEEEWDVDAYKFLHPETGRKFILYRLGTWINDKALLNNPELKIEDLATMTHEEILSLSGL